MKFTRLFLAALLLASPVVSQAAGGHFICPDESPGNDVLVRVSLSQTPTLSTEYCLVLGEVADLGASLGLRFNQNYTIKFVKVIPGYRVRLFEYRNYGGESVALAGLGQIIVPQALSSAQSFRTERLEYEVAFPRACAERGGKAVFWDEVYYGNYSPNPRYHCITEDQTVLSGSGITATGSFRACSVYVKPGYKLVAFTRSDYGSGTASNSGNSNDLNSPRVFRENTSIGDLTKGRNPFEVRSYLLVPSVAIEEVEETTRRVTLAYSRGRERSTTSWSRGGAAFRKTDEAIEISRDADPERWEALVSLDDLRGVAGAPGEQGQQGPAGAQGQKPILGINAERTHIVYRYADDDPWQDLIALSDLKGDQGDRGLTGSAGPRGYPDGTIVQDVLEEEVACNAETRGTTRFNTGSGWLEFCDVDGWRSRAETQSLACDYTRRGTTRFNAASGLAEVCDSYEWRSRAETAPTPGYIGDVAELGSAGSGGGLYQCAINAHGAARCWNRDGSDFPAGSNFLIAGPVSQIATGRYFTCVLDRNGHIRCWGDNRYGQITLPDALNPDSPGTATVTKHISGGAWHTCALDESGRVRCWGLGSDLDLREGVYDFNQAIPPDALKPEAPDGVTITQIAAGTWHTCALDKSGRVHCWGYSVFGRTNPPDELKPGAAGTVMATQITAGEHHNCVLDGAERVRCWGSDYQGRANPPDELRPEARGAVTATQIAGGGYHTCVVDGTGRVRCWGSNQYGQMTPPDELKPGFPGTVTATQIATGNYHTCVVDGTGRVRCWGVGNDRNRNEGVFDYDQADPPYELKPGSPGTVTAERIAAGRYHTCVLTTDSDVICWGVGDDPTRDEDGIGDKDNDQSLALSVAVEPARRAAEPVRQIATGRLHACALDADRRVVCWGAGGHGRSAAPAASTAVRQVVAGEVHSCLLTMDNAVHCWGLGTDRGRDEDGAAGNRDHDQASPPDEINALSPLDQGDRVQVRQIAAGAHHTCAVDVTNHARCWGKNDHGQSPESPPVPADAVVRQLALGDKHTCALTVGNDVHCWGLGADRDRNEGEDDFNQAAPPPAVKMRRITADLFNTCGLDLDGYVHCWGAGERGATGGHNYGQSDPPDELRPSGATRSRHITAGRWHTCAVTMADEVKCWGGKPESADDPVESGTFTVPGDLGQVKGI